MTVIGVVIGVWVVMVIASFIRRRRHCSIAGDYGSVARAGHHDGFLLTTDY
ncbi:MAG: hypothetical protein HYR56_31905 [Acidobacteria bacterium]|nr:hypothetical protein [Acidobacteriota bacterium]MBI3424299.1 hypothetical protein [Acidobacteriota bacterium]